MAAGTPSARRSPIGRALRTGTERAGHQYDSLQSNAEHVLVERVQAARYQRLAQSQRHGDPLKWFAVACLGAFTLLTVAVRV